MTESIVSALGGSPLAEFKDEQGTIEYREDDWENDPQNARTWTLPLKWTTVSIVRLCSLASYVLELTSGIHFPSRYLCILLSTRCPAG